MKSTTRRFCRFVLVLAPLAPLAILAAGCDVGQPIKFDPVSLQRLNRDAAKTNVNPPMEPAPLGLNRQYLDRLDPGATSRPTTVGTAAALPASGPSGLGPSVRMSLRELVRLAAANSFQIKVANFQPGIDAARVQEAEARFDPVFFTNLNFATQYVLTPTAQNISSSNVTFETTTLQTGFRQNLATGAQVQLQYQATRTFERFLGGLNPGSGQGEPTFESSLQLQVTQPLLQNAGRVVNEARIVVARNTQRVSLLDARVQLEKTLTEIEQIYWQLVQAESELAIQEQLYQQAIDTATYLQKRAAMNTAVSRGQANASLRARESALVDARHRLVQLSNELKARVNDPKMPTSGGVLVLADDAPLRDPIRFDLAEQIESALANRAELAQQQIRIDSAAVVVSAAQNNLLPQLNLVGSIGTKGSASAFGSALNDQFVDWNAREYAIGFQLEVPLGNREARAIFRRTKLQEMQAIYQYADLIEQVSKEVRNAHDDVINAWQKMRATNQSVRAQRYYLEQIQIEENSNARIIDEDFVNRKLNAQEQLAQEMRQDVAAVAAYNTAIANLEKAKGTILKYDNVIMRQEPLSTDPAVTGIVHRTQE